MRSCSWSNRTRWIWPARDDDGSERAGHDVQLRSIPQRYQRCIQTLRSPRPTVSYTYDAQYGPVATRTDGTGVTTYAYHPVGGLGAGQLATVDGPLIDDTITYTCDQLGRVIVRAINSVGVTLAFDALGRVTSEVNVLGTFGYTYDGVSGRVAGVTHPNQQTRISTLLPQTAEAGRSCVLLVSLTFASWNQIGEWLCQLEALRKT
jgi:YD repeat-containing protein